MARKTEQKAAIRRAIEEAQRPLGAQEVLTAAQSFTPGLGIATVYRNLKTLVEEGWLAPVELPGEPCRYEIADLDHHHHFQCGYCGRVFDIPGCSKAIERSVPEGFAVERHEVLLYGRCADCATG